MWRRSGVYTTQVRQHTPRTLCTSCVCFQNDMMKMCRHSEAPPDADTVDLPIKYFRTCTFSQPTILQPIPLAVSFAKSRFESTVETKGSRVLFTLTLAKGTN